jgi:TolB protein
VPAGTVESLFLVDPAGGRYLVTTFPQSSDESLTAWSGDGRRALLSATTGTGEPATTSLTVLDLTTGHTIDTFSIPQTPPNTITFTKPNGLAVLATSSDGASLVRYGLDGSTQLTYPGTFTQLGAFVGTYLSSPDGTKLLIGTNRGIAVVANDGRVISQLSAALPGETAASFCSPSRWWSAGVALVPCGGRLWEVPVSGATPTALTAAPIAPDSADLNAWKTPSGVYVQDAGGCGYQYLAKLQPDGTTSPVTVPDVDTGHSQFVVGTHAGELGLWATVSCGAGVSALWFDPATNTSKVVLGPPVNGGSVTAVLGYPDPNG